MNTTQDRLTELGHAFHRDPDLGFQENRTQANVAGPLRALGLEVQDGAGVVGLPRSGSGNRAAGLEADGDRPPTGFSEDFAHVSTAVPGCLPLGATFWAELVRDRLLARQDM